jgi:hypothetical protein
MPRIFAKRWMRLGLLRFLGGNFLRASGVAEE